MRFKGFAGTGAMALMALATGADVRQAWVATYDSPTQGEDIFGDIVFDDDGNLIIPGWTIHPQTGYDFLLVKYDSAGRLLWARTWDGPDHGDDQSFTAAVDAAGNIYMVGVSMGATTDRDIVTLKYASNGSLLWERRYDGEAHGEEGVWGSRMVGLDAAGDVYVAGYTELTGGGLAAVAIKYAPNGDEQWVRTYEAPNPNCPYATGYALAVTPSGDVYVAGDYWSSDCSGSDLGLVVYDSDGNLKWTARYDGPYHGWDGTYAIAVDAAGAAYLAGIADTPGGFESVLVKMNSSGVVWSQRYGGNAGYHYAFSVAVDAQNNAFMCGNSMTGGGEYDMFTLKADADGSLAWVQRYRTQWFAEDNASDVRIGPDGSAYVTGYVWNGFSRDNDAVTLKYDADGNLVWEQIYNGPVSGSDSNFAVALDANGNIYTAGWTLGSTRATDGLLIKYLEAPCTGGETIDSVNCKQRGSSHLLIIKLSGGLPGDPVAVELTSGQSGSALVKDTGKAKVKIKSVASGSGLAAVIWGCGTTADSPYDCQ